MDSSRTLSSLTALTIAAVGLGTPAAAAPVDPPVPGTVEVLSPQPFGESMVTDRQGGTTVVWTRSLRSPAVLAMSRPAGGDWGERHVLGRGYQPRLAVDAAGHLTAVWLDLAEGVSAARGTPDDGWSDARRLSAPQVAGQGGRVSQYDVAAAPAGAVDVVWRSTTGRGDHPFRIQAVHRPRGGAWGTPSTVTRDSRVSDPHVGTDGSGIATLVYSNVSDPTTPVLTARRRLPGTGWSAPLRIAGEGWAPQLVVDRAGTALVVFSPDAGTHLSSVVRPAGGHWRNPRPLTPSGSQVDAASLVMNRGGTAVLAWAGEDGRVQVLHRQPSSGWSAPHTVAEPGKGGAAFVTASIGPRDDVMVGWGRYALFVAHHPGGQGWDVWSMPAIVAPDLGEVLETVLLATGPSGESTALWKQEERAMRARSLTPAG